MIERPTNPGPFNTALETGLRSTAILAAAFPASFDLHLLVIFDHLVVHTRDVGGPESLHANVPMRSAELLVRRDLVDRGLMLMMSRGLVDRHVGETGITFAAGDFAETFLATLTSAYLADLRDRSRWVANWYSQLGEEEFKRQIDRYFGNWVHQFQGAHRSLAGHL